MWIDILQTTFDGLMVGGLYASVALGITLVLGLVGVVNFAHGQMVMLGAYVTFFVAAVWGFWVGLAVAMISMAALGIAFEALLFRHTIGNHMMGLTISLGLIMIIDNLATNAFSPDPKFLDAPLSGAIEIGPLLLSAQRSLVLVITLVLIGAFYLFLKKSRLGKGIRGMAQNRQAAALVGVRVSHVTPLIFAVGSALAGAAGALFASLFPIQPFMGATPLMKGFIVATLGGIGSVPGAIGAGFVLGMSESFGARYLDAAFRDGYGFILMIFVLLFRPSGLFGASTKVRV
jgi:branched-chain amino acid transport system permease protein